MRKPFLQRIDFYIMGKFLGTFFLAIILIISISIVFDVSENVDKFIDKEAPLKAILVDYYLNFIPYFANLFSGLFTFIAVIFFTSKMASSSEIIAILAGGVSYKRLMRSYLVSAFIIASMSWVLGNFIIPPANKARVDFRNKYLKHGSAENHDKDIHRQLEPGIYMYMSSYSTRTDTGWKFSLEKFEDNKLVSKLVSSYIKWDRNKDKWTVHDYYIRDFDGDKEILTYGREIDTTLALFPKDFKRRTNEMESMDLFELQDFIRDQRLRGVSNLGAYEVEKYKRTSGPFSAFILTIIGAALASRKVRGGIGLHLGLGVLLSFTYIMFMQITTVFAINGNASPLLAVWIPNIVFSFIAIYLYRKASK